MPEREQSVNIYKNNISIKSSKSMMGSIIINFFLLDPQIHFN